MAYIAFFDMVGIRASALTSNQEYTASINEFNDTLKQVSRRCNCKIYGYSDNAYVEIDSLEDVIKFFRLLRDTLMKTHRYFSAYVDKGSLNSDKVVFENKKGFSMKFTDPATIGIYLNQCQFSGIGISLSQKVVDDLIYNNMCDDFCVSIFEKRDSSTKEKMEFVSLYDVSYNKFGLAKLEYVISDYLMTAAMDERAGRYYITPIISMVKSIDKSIIDEKLDGLISILKFEKIPEVFRNLPHQENYRLLFMLAFIDRIYCIKDRDGSINAKTICEKIIKNFGFSNERLMENLPLVSTSIISKLNKQRFLYVLYNLK
ncbi:MAG: hypothetical protein IJA80_05440 [Clostridia bacterium]|nr:hypothetical protein [Clostridia bacterium]